MTTGEMIAELRASLGNRTDITDARYVTWLNWAQYDLCGFHQKRVFPSLRFRGLEAKFFLNLPVVTGQVTAFTDSTFTLSGVLQPDGFFDDCVVRITGHTGTPPDNLIGQTRSIVAYSGVTGVATIDEDWDVNPDTDTEYEIYQREFDLEEFGNISVSTDLWAIERVETLRGYEIHGKDWEDIVHRDPRSSIGRLPSEYARRGNYIIFDIAPEEPISLRIWYYRFPPMLTATDPDQESVLPEAWHEIVVLGAVWRGHEALMEPARAEEAFTVYKDRATHRINQYQIEDRQISRGLKVRSYRRA